MKIEDKKTLREGSKYERRPGDGMQGAFKGMGQTECLGMVPCGHKQPVGDSSDVGHLTHAVLQSCSENDQ